MNNQINRNAGIALITGSIMMIFTMVLHPVGGSFDRLINSTLLIIFTHSIAILSVPFNIFGFWGLYKYLNKNLILSAFSLIITVLGQIAVMCAAAINGLAFPFFLNHLHRDGLNISDATSQILTYGTSINHAFDYIYIGFSILTVLFWSITIFKTQLFPLWLAIAGTVISFGITLLLLFGIVSVDLNGFRLFILGFVGWTLMIGIILIRHKS